MAFKKITDADLVGKGNVGRPDTPGVTTAEMQRIMDELPREVIVPAFNELAGQLEAETAAAGLGAALPADLPAVTPKTVQGLLEAVLAYAKAGFAAAASALGAHTQRTDNPHGVTAAQAGAYTKAETDAAINAKVVEIGTGDMAQSVYDPTGQKRDVFAAITSAKNEALAAADTAKQTADAKGVNIYTHARTGTVNEFTGTGANGRALMTADVREGDTFTVNGRPATAYVGAEDAVGMLAGQPYSGKWVTFVAEGDSLNFKGGGGLPMAAKALLVPQNIREGVHIQGGGVDVVGTVKGYYDLGVGTSFDVSAFAGYETFTADDFMVQPDEVLSGSDSKSGGADWYINSVRTNLSASAGVTKSYDAATGIFTCQFTLSASASGGYGTEPRVSRTGNCKVILMMRPQSSSEGASL